MLQYAMEYVRSAQLPGDFLEFGVYEGVSLARAFRFARMKGINEMRFIAFDSFQGLPAATGSDAVAYEQFRQGEYAASVDEVQQKLRAYQVDLDLVHLVPGWYEQTLVEDTKQRFALRQAAVVHIDCDLYKSAVPALRFITDLVQDGTVLIFDDWFCFRGSPEHGEQRAFREWLADNPSLRASEFHRFSWHGNSFLLHR